MSTVTLLGTTQMGFALWPAAKAALASLSPTGQHLEPLHVASPAHVLPDHSGRPFNDLPRVTGALISTTASSKGRQDHIRSPEKSTEMLARMVLAPDRTVHHRKPRQSDRRHCNSPCDAPQSPGHHMHRVAEGICGGLEGLLILNDG